MAENIVVNGVNYNGVDSVEFETPEGKSAAFYPDAVRYSPQELTDEQKAVARKNIGASSYNGEDAPSAAAWKNITDKPFTASTTNILTWDGDMTDKELIGELLVKISDEVVSPEALAQGGSITAPTLTAIGCPVSIAYWSAEEVIEMTPGMFAPMPAALMDIGFPLVVCVQTRITDPEVGTLEPGVYFVWMPLDETSALHPTEVAFYGHEFSSGEIINREALPEQLRFGPTNERIEEVLPETVLTDSVAGAEASNKLSKTISVTYDGVKYKCSSMALPELSPNVVCYGNLSIVASVFTNTGEPFCILTSKQTREIAIYKPVDDVGTHTISISAKVYDAVPVDSEWLPEHVTNVQSDWNQTDETADDYIKNKPNIAAESSAIYLQALSRSSETVYRLYEYGATPHEPITLARLKEIVMTKKAIMLGTPDGKSSCSYPLTIHPNGAEGYGYIRYVRYDANGGVKYATAYTAEYTPS